MTCNLPGGVSPSLRSLFRIPAEKAFSLIEVTLAIGIISFALISVLGTLPVALTAIHDATIDTTHAQIIAQVSSTVLETPFDRIPSYASSGPFFFDRVGRQLDNSGGALYSATLNADSGGSSTYPGAPSTLADSAIKVGITVSTLRPGTTDALSSSRAVLIVARS